MKKLMVMLALSALAVTAGAKTATIETERPTYSPGCMRDWTPFALTICGPIGIPLGYWDVKGLQIGIINKTYQFSGLQLGVINISERAYGLQVGVINVISADDCPFLPVVNWSF